MYVYQLGTRQNGTSPITIPLVYETAHAHVGAVTSGTRSGRAGSLFLRRRPAPPRRSENAGNHSAQAMPSKHEGAHHLMVGISSPSLHEQSSRTENSNSHFGRDRKPHVPGLQTWEEGRKKTATIAFQSSSHTRQYPPRMPPDFQTLGSDRPAHARKLSASPPLTKSPQAGARNLHSRDA
jgi:hypothetical protein